jgi:hypothetical protein
MQFKPSDILAWAGVISGGLIAMKKPKKVIGWFLIIASCIYFSIAAFTTNTERSDSHNQTATTAGNNSPTYQAGHDITVQNGVSEATLQKVLSLKDVELTERIQNEFPQGCVLLGMQNGKVLYDSRLRDIAFTADWDNARLKVEGTNAMIDIQHIDVYYQRNLSVVKNFSIVQSWAFFEGQPKMGPIPNLYYEVLDAKRGIFIIGFK